MDQNNPQTPVSSGRKQNTLMGVLAYILFFIPMITGDAKKDEFVKYHVKQGFALFVVEVAVYVIGWVMPYYFWWQISWIVNLALFVLFVLGIVNVVNGKKAPLPVIGILGSWLKI